MRLSRKSEYACLALLDLAERYAEGLTKIDQIAERKKIPKKYLEQILLLLKSTGHVRSVRGAEGGYRLARPPREITLAEIIRVIEGPLAPVESVSKYFYEHTPIEASPKLVGLLQEIRDYIAERMENTTFADLV